MANEGLLILGSPTKNIMILVVTVTGQGDNPIYKIYAMRRHDLYLLKVNLPKTGKTSSRHVPDTCPGKQNWSSHREGFRNHAKQNACISYTLEQTNIAVEDVYPIEHGDIPLPCLFAGGYSLSTNLRKLFLQVAVLPGNKTPRVFPQMWQMCHPERSGNAMATHIGAGVPKTPKLT